jgi:hypothetical protein
MLNFRKIKRFSQIQIRPFSQSAKLVEEHRCCSGEERKKEVQNIWKAHNRDTFSAAAEK